MDLIALTMLLIYYLRHSRGLPFLIHYVTLKNYLKLERLADLGLSYADTVMQVRVCKIVN